MIEMNQNIHIRVLGGVVILTTLIWAHMTPMNVVTILPTMYHGVQPVTQSPLPLSADDIARGLLFNPDISINGSTLEKAHRLRKELSKRADNHHRLNLQAQRESVRLLHMLDERQ